MTLPTWVGCLMANAALSLAVIGVACGRPAGRTSSDSAAPPSVESAIAAGIVSETIPAAPHTWDLGSVDTFMISNLPGAKRVPQPEPLLTVGLSGGPNVEYAGGGIRVQFYLFGDQVAAGRAAAALMLARDDSVRTFTSSNLLVLMTPVRAPASDRLERLLRSHDFRSAGPPRPP